jgi:putative tryptophan/tyrosine transport system substrate-binding protein
MKRREFIAGLGGAVAWPLGAWAEQDERARRVGVVMGLDENDPEGKAQLSGLIHSLAELGWTGRNTRMEVRWGGDNADRMRVLAKELVALQPEVIVSEGTPVTAALQGETRTIPIVFVVVGDPVGDGFVESLARPGGNLTGFGVAERAMGGKWLELLVEIAANLKRVAMMFNPDTAPGRGSYYYRDFEAAARLLKLTPFAAPIGSNTEIKTVVTSLGQESGGLIVIADHFLQAHVAPIISLTAQNNVPAVYPWRYAVAKDGGLLSYGPDLRDVVRRAAPYVDSILRGVKPTDLPVQLPTKYEMAVNARTAKALGLTIPPNLLAIADEVIE